MKKRYLLPLLLAAALPANAFAESPLGEGGFGGSVELMAGYGSSKSNFDTEEATKEEPLNSSGKNRSEFNFSPGLQVHYTFGPRDNYQLFTSIGGFDVTNAGSIFGDFGFSTVIGDESILTLTASPGFDKDETWSNPYLTGENRETTDVKIATYNVEYSNVADTGIDLSAGYYSHDLDSEQSGDKALDRNGKGFTAGVSMPFELGDGFILTPGLTYDHFGADGKAMAYNKYGASLTLGYELGRHGFTLSAGGSYANYDGSNPLFNKTRRDIGYSAGVSYEYNELFDVDGLALVLSAEYEKSDANIDFYDTSSMNMMAGLRYSF